MFCFRRSLRGKLGRAVHLDWWFRGHLTPIRKPNGEAPPRSKSHQAKPSQTKPPDGRRALASGLPGFTATSSAYSPCAARRREDTGGGAAGGRGRRASGASGLGQRAGSGVWVLTSRIMLECSKNLGPDSQFSGPPLLIGLVVGLGA